jgi:UDP-glucuronate 4-epimerase
MGRNIIVTGGAGFIGSHLVDHLLAQGDSVEIVDNFDSFYSDQVKSENIEHALLHPNCVLRRIDIRDAQALEDQLKNHYDLIVHLAAKAGVRPSIENPIAYQEVNVNGTQNILEFARKRSIPKVVFASSSSVYGINPRVPWEESDLELQPISPYASTKISCELMGHVYQHLYGINFIALRFFTVYGPRQRPDLAIHKFTRLIDQGDSIPVYGDGSTRRDYTYIDDIIQGLVAAVEKDLNGFHVINLGNHETVSLSEMISEIENAVGKKAVINRLPEQPGDVPQTFASVKRALNLLDYKPETDFSTGIRNFIDWYRLNAK